jgi:MYXO-CTERM domain-containing protein
MRGRRLLVLLAFASVALLAAAWAAGASASGAANGTNKSGCTCHSPQPGPLARVQLAGVPKNYTPGQAYELTLHIDGNTPMGISNQGGFAVGADAGNFSVLDDKAQIKNGMVTHTAAGNDQRSWKFTWTAPTNGTSPVTFNYAGNAVNGDNVADPGDQWQKGVETTTLGAAPTNTTSPIPTPTTTPTDTPSIGHVGLALAVAAGFAWRRRRT